MIIFLTFCNYLKLHLFFKYEFTVKTMITKKNGKTFLKKTHFRFLFGVMFKSDNTSLRKDGTFIIIFGKQKYLKKKTLINNIKLDGKNLYIQCMSYLLKLLFITYFIALI